MKRRLAWLTAVLVVAVPALVLLSTNQAGANSEFSFIEHQTNVEFVINGRPTLQPAGPFSPGDELLLRSDLLQGTTNIGFDNGKCTVTFNDNFLCDAVFSFTNRGDVFVSALLRGAAASENGPSIFDAAIMGGTFAYRNAHGDGHAVSVNSGDMSWTFNLVTQ